MRLTVERGMACRYTKRVWNQPIATYQRTQQGRRDDAGKIIKDHDSINGNFPAAVEMPSILEHKTLAANILHAC